MVKGYQQMQTACPCGAAATYAACCGRYIDGNAVAPTAPEVMRSRYSAYVLEKSAYLLATWHPSTRPPGLTFEPPQPRWLGLDIRAVTQQDERHAGVEFIARLKIDGRAHRLHESSRFVLENGRWLYLNGDSTA